MFSQTLQAISCVCHQSWLRLNGCQIHGKSNNALSFNFYKKYYRKAWMYLGEIPKDSDDILMLKLKEWFNFFFLNLIRSSERDYILNTNITVEMV